LLGKTTCISMGAIYAICTCPNHMMELTSNQPTNHPVCQPTIPSANQPFRLPTNHSVCQRRHMILRHMLRRYITLISAFFTLTSHTPFSYSSRTSATFPIFYSGLKGVVIVPFRSIDVCTLLKQLSLHFLQLQRLEGRCRSIPVH
jgi:hypothetical protein